MKTYEATAADGTRLYYEVSGLPVGKAPTVVLADGIGCDGFVWRYLRPWLDEAWTVVHPHYRGHGQSGAAVDGESYTMGDNVSDLQCVMDAVGARDAVVLGHSMGVQVALELALTTPARVRGLVLLCGSFGRPLDTWHDHAGLKTVLPVAREVIDRYSDLFMPVVRKLMPTAIGWHVARLTEVDGTMMRREDFQPYLQHLADMDPRIFTRMLAQAARHTTEDRLHLVKQPVLIVGGEKDRFTPFWVSEVLADRLPSPRLHMIKGGTHAAPLEHPRLTELLITEWLDETGLSRSRTGRKRAPRKKAGSGRKRAADQKVASSS